MPERCKPPVMVARIVHPHRDVQGDYGPPRGLARVRSRCRWPDVARHPPPARRAPSQPLIGVAALGPLSARPPPIFPASPLQLEVGPQDQGGPMVPSALKMQHRCPDPPLKAGDFDFYVSLLPTS